MSSIEEPGPLISAAMSGNSAVIKDLLDDPGSCNLLETDAQGKTALHWASYFNECSVMIELFKRNVIPVNAPSKRKETPLHVSCCSGSLAAISLLLEQPEIEINAQNIWGESACHLACGSGNAEAVTLLVNNPYYDNSIKDIWDRTAEEVAHQHGYEKARLALVTASSSSSLSPSLLSSSVSVPIKEMEMVKNKKLLPLSKMIEFPGDVEEMKRLIDEEQVHPGGTDMFGWTALHKASSWNNVEMINILLNCLTTLEINAKGGPDLNTALHCCIDMGAKNALCTLLEDGRSHANIFNAKRQTPLMMSIEMQLTEFSDVIRNHLQHSLSSHSSTYQTTGPDEEHLLEKDHKNTEHFNEYHKIVAETPEGIVKQNRPLLANALDKGM